jgi:hypothetical protein
MATVSGILIQLAGEMLRWWALAFRSSQSIKAENLFLRRQLALYIERGVKPRRIDPVTRIGLTLLSRLFDWRDALVVVRPETMIRWHRAGMEAVLAVEVTTRSTADSAADAGFDPPDGQRESRVGRGTHCQ